MNDMSAVIVPKSDQFNADSFLSGPRTFVIENVSITLGTEQPVAIKMKGETLVWRPCKSMSRCLVAAWGPDASQYAGRSVTLFCDPSVKWGGMEVGGIRISHMSHIERDMVMALTTTKSNKKPYRVRQLVVAQPTETTHLARDETPLYQRVSAAVEKVQALRATMPNVERCEALTRPLLAELDAAGMPAEKEALLMVLRDMRAAAEQGDAA
jgi:hypothetical protein